jgi:hypothetical protein
MLNDWDGRLEIDEEDNTIMTMMIGAGRKNSNNQFNGVLMGDVMTGTGDNATREIGLYGFHEGAQSFGFKIDGTAFLGKSGKGQIRFNGNNGIIESGNYISTENATIEKPASGMKIDLSNGHIDAYNFKLTSEKFELNNTPFNYTIGMGVNQIVLGDEATNDFDKNAGGVIFGANNNFAITENGYVYAKAGKIGVLEIDEIPKKINDA